MTSALAQAPSATRCSPLSAGATGGPTSTAESRERSRTSAAGPCVPCRPGDHGPADAVHCARRLLCRAAALLLAPVAAADGGDRLLLPARRRLDGDLHR